MEFLTQLKSRLWAVTLVACGVVELLSLLGWSNETFSHAMFVVLSAAALIVSVINPRAGFLLLLAEMIIGGHGHFFGWGPVSIRMTLFGSVLTGWIISLFRAQQGHRRHEAMPLIFPLSAVAWVVGWGCLLGNALDRSAANIIADANAYVYILIVPVAMDLFRDRESMKSVGEVFAGAIIWLSVKSLALLYLFTHAFGPLLETVRLWQRQLFLTELTSMGAWTRVFSASDVLLIPAIFAGLWLAWRTRARNWWIVILLIATLLLSFSRSIWLGMIVGAISAIPFAWRATYFDRKNILKLVSVTAIAVVLALGLLVALVFVPIPAHQGYGTAANGNRLMATDDAASSRWNMLPPLVAAIKADPVLGSGFGTQISYMTDDPRLKELYHGSLVTTSAIEWQYLDIWLKMGLPGVLAFAWFFSAILRHLVAAMQKKYDEGISVAAFACFVAFLVANIFTPYINHPLGWMFLAIVIIITNIPSPDKIIDG